MIPERITGKKYGYPSDICSVMFIIYEKASGDKLYGGGTDFLTQLKKISGKSRAEVGWKYI